MSLSSDSLLINLFHQAKPSYTKLLRVPIQRHLPEHILRTAPHQYFILSVCPISHLSIRIPITTPPSLAFSKFIVLIPPPLLFNPPEAIPPFSTLWAHLIRPLTSTEFSPLITFPHHHPSQYRQTLLFLSRCIFDPYPPHWRLTMTGVPPSSWPTPQHHPSLTIHPINIHH